jgi:hypothetical protein
MNSTLHTAFNAAESRASASRLLEMRATTIILRLLPSTARMKGNRAITTRCHNPTARLQTLGHMHSR